MVVNEVAPLLSAQKEIAQSARQSGQKTDFLPYSLPIPTPHKRLEGRKFNNDEI